MLVLDSEDDDRSRPRRVSPDQLYGYSQALTAIKSFYRLSDGIETVFLVNRNGQVLDIVEVARYAEAAPLTVPARRAIGSMRWRPPAIEHVCIVLSPSHEIKVFAEGVQTFSFRNARWHLLDLQAKYEMWQAAIENARAGGASVPDGRRSGGLA